jgi:hypothetical protein
MRAFCVRMTCLTPTRRCERIEERAVNFAKVISGVALLVAGVFGVGTAPPATATDGNYAINGTFLVVSDGQWAKTNDRYHDEPTVTSSWTVSSTCSQPTTCSGKVTSTLGWTEDIYTTNGLWYVKHNIPAWMPCPDGTTAPGLQMYKFYAVAEDGSTEQTSNNFVGQDQTTGLSGNCGKNLPLKIVLPLRISKIDRPTT